MWVTQLVVKEEYRHQGIATQLVTRSWTKDVISGGLVSSNPYAVRALERASQRKCTPHLMAQCAEELVQNSQIPYVQNCELVITNSKSIISTKFYVDHIEVNKVLCDSSEWKLGSSLLLCLWISGGRFLCRSCRSGLN